MRRSRILALAVSAALALLPPWGLVTPALAGGGYSGGGKCAPPPTIININKNIDINKNININKNVNINKNISIFKPVLINKNIIINKVNASSSSDSFAAAAALAFAGARAQSVSTGGGGSIIQESGRVSQGEIGGAAAVTQEACVEQWATVVKAVHAVCVDHWGHSHPATRMRPETWIDASYSGELYRCLEGSSLRVIVGHVVQSNEGAAAVYDGGDQIECRSGEALRHFADGLVKCAVAEPVPDCTERTNLRRYGAGDIFFSFQEKVCAQSYSASETMSHASIELSNMTLSGGVGN